MKLLKCNACGKLALIVKDSACPTKCCGQDMAEQVPNTVEAAHEKHIPVVKADGAAVTVEVGSVAHPMLAEHYIMFIILETSEGIQKKDLKPGDAPKAVFALAPGEKAVAAYAYCNLHGFWKAEI